MGSGSAAYLTASNDPSSNPDLVWTLELTREWQDMEWFTSASLRPWQRFALQSLSSQSYLYGPVCKEGDINDLYTGIGPPETDPAYLGNNRFSLTNQASGHLLNGRNIADTGLNGAWLDASGSNPSSDSHLQWHIVYLYG